MPEAQKDDRFDDGKFENRVVGREQVFGGKEEEEERVESQCDGDVVDDRDVKIAGLGAIKRKEKVTIPSIRRAEIDKGRVGSWQEIMNR